MPGRAEQSFFEGPPPPGPAPVVLFFRSASERGTRPNQGDELVQVKCQIAKLGQLARLPDRATIITSGCSRSGFKRRRRW